MATALAALPARKEEFAVLPGTAENGRHIFAVLVKRTYAIAPGQRAVRAETKPLVPVDVYYDHGDAETSTVLFETDLTTYKLATDLVFIAKAYAPGAQPVQQMDVGIRVAGRTKILRITGDRYCLYQPGRLPQFTEPAPFTEMEIRYDRAYGGEDVMSDPNLPFFYPRNHRGKGVAIRNIPEVVHGLALPNIEDPADMITPERVIIGAYDQWNPQPLPAGFGWFQRTWYPRASFVGAIPGLMDPDTVMREELLGLVPKGQIALARQFKLPSFDLRFNNGGSLGQILPYLRGDEEISTHGLTQEGRFDFLLPDDAPTISLDTGQGENKLEAVLHTVSVRMDDREVDLVWRGALEYPGPDWIPKMTKLEARIE
jgi:hypothetical protein